MPRYIEMSAGNVAIQVEVDETGTGVVGGADLRAFLTGIAAVVGEATAALTEQEGTKAEVEFAVTTSDGGVPIIVLDRARGNFHVRVLVETVDLKKSLDSIKEQGTPQS